MDGFAFHGDCEFDPSNTSIPCNGISYYTSGSRSPHWKTLEYPVKHCNSDVFKDPHPTVAWVKVSIVSGLIFYCNLGAFPAPSTSEALPAKADPMIVLRTPEPTETRTLGVGCNCSQTFSNWGLMNPSSQESLETGALESYRSYTEHGFSKQGLDGILPGTVKDGPELSASPAGHRTAAATVAMPAISPRPAGRGEEHEPHLCRICSLTLLLR